MFLQYGDSGQSFLKDSIVRRTRARTSICRNGIHSTFVELKLLWNR